VLRSLHDRSTLGEPRWQITVRDQQTDNPFSKDLQVTGIHNSLAHSGDSLARTADPHNSSTPAPAR
jgi:predicted oxidoreductase